MISHLRYFLALAVLASSGNLVSGQSFTSRVLQDELRELPADNTAFLTAAREVSIQLDLLAAADADLDDAVVSVVSIDGSSRDFKPDEDGIVTINDAAVGPHAIVASSKTAHGTSLLYFNEPGAVADELPAAKVPTRVTMVAVQPDTLRPFVDQIAHLNGNPDSVINQVGSGPLFGYRVQLGPEGTLHGRVLSLQKGIDQSRLDVGVQGTRVAILQGGNVVANAIADSTGDFFIPNLRPGVYGCIATSSVGYAAFGFETLAATGLVGRGSNAKYVSKVQDPAEILPVVLVPNTFIPAVYQELLDYYPELEPLIEESLFTTGQPIMPYSGGAGAGGGGAGGGAGGLGGLAALAGLGALAAAASSNDNDGVLIEPPPASPVSPE